MFKIEEFSDRLKELRKDFKISSVDLGKAIGVSHGAISRWEHCSRVPSAENIYNLAKFFGVSADYLLGLED